MRSGRIKEKVYGPDHPAVANVSYQLGALYLDQKHYKEAEDAFKRALAFYDKAKDPKPTMVIATLTEYAKLMRATSQKAEAERLELRAAGITEKQRQSAAH